MLIVQRKQNIIIRNKVVDSLKCVEKQNIIIRLNLLLKGKGFNFTNPITEHIPVLLINEFLCGLV